MEYDFKTILKISRIKSELTQKDVANMSKIHQSSISMYELGKIYPSVESFNKIVSVYEKTGKLDAQEINDLKRSYYFKGSIQNNNYVDRTIEIPENVADYIKTHDGTNLEISLNAAFADYGYAHILHKTIIISKLTRTCNRCGYDPLWNPDDSESKCQRHTYDNWRYDPVFALYPNAGIGLEEAFEDWLSIQPSENEFDKPAKYKKYGKAKW